MRVTSLPAAFHADNWAEVAVAVLPHLGERLRILLRVPLKSRGVHPSDLKSLQLEVDFESIQMPFVLSDLSSVDSPSANTHLQTSPLKVPVW